MPTRVEIRLLGPPRVVVSGQIAPTRRRKALGLAAFLAASRVPCTRGLLAATFWPDADHEGAHAQLRNHLWVLRRAGLTPWLALEGEIVALRSGEGLWVDVREHRRLLESAGLVTGRGGALPAGAESILSQAVALYQDHFLAGFSFPDSVAFEEWQLREEEALRTSQGAALDALIHLRERLGDLEGALASAQQRTQLDPLNEQALRSVMTLYLRLGRRGEALQAYERFSALLERDLEIAPSRETILLRNEIATGGARPLRPVPAANVPPRSVLPEPPTPFVGRERELDEIARCFDAPELRLFTLTGPGGCGKTRLALEAGRRLSPLFPDGVVFAPLATMAAGHLLPVALAEVLSLPLAAHDRVPAPGPREGLIGFLREKRILLILDNLEQMAGDLQSLREILAGTRGTVVLATSRTRLRLAGEQVLEVEGLPWPARKASPEEVQRCASVRLFLQTVRRVRGPFTPARAEWGAAGEIARRLRGHPLGLELAASWAHTLSVVEIAAQLTVSLDLEAAPRADVPARHRSLREVFEQSWALLSPDERAAFRRLCCLPGSFDREAALEIGGSTPAIFTALIEQSFLRRTGDRRFEILETLRQFGREKLAANLREESAVRDRSARHYLNRLIEARGALEGAGQKKALHELARDRHNLRQAWLRASERGWVAEMLKAVRPLFLFYDMSSRVVEGAETTGLVLRSLLRRPQSAPARRPASIPARRLIALSRIAQAWFLRFEGRGRGRGMMRQGLRDLRTVGTPVERAFGEALAALVDPFSPRAERALREGGYQCERAGDLWCAGLVWEVLACHLLVSDPEEGFRVLHRSLALRRRCRDRWSIALGLYVVGLSLEQRGLLRGARRRFEESLALRRRLGADTDGILDCLEGISRMALRSGALADARQHAAESLVLAERLGIRAKIARAQTRLAQIHCLMGAPVEARPLLDAALVTSESLGNAPWSAHLHVLGGIAALDLGDAGEAGWCLERAMSAAAPETEPGPGTQPGWLSRDTAAWRDLLAGRLALADEHASPASEPLAGALRGALAARHEPLVAETLSGWVELYKCAGHTAAAGRLATVLLASPVLSEPRRARLEQLLAESSGAADVPPGAPPNTPAVLLPGAVLHTPAAPSSDAAPLLRVAADLLAEEQPRI